MELSGWIGLSAAALVGIAAAFAMPAFLRDARRRQSRGAGGSLSGLAGGMDAVWRPSVEDAHAQWQAQLEVPAPAPTPGDKGGLEEGRLVIEVPRGANDA